MKWLSHKTYLSLFQSHPGSYLKEGYEYFPKQNLYFWTTCYGLPVFPVSNLNVPGKTRRLWYSEIITIIFRQFSIYGNNIMYFYCQVTTIYIDFALGCVFSPVDILPYITFTTYLYLYIRVVLHCVCFVLSSLRF